MWISFSSSIFDSFFETVQQFQSHKFLERSYTLRSLCSEVSYRDVRFSSHVNMTFHLQYLEELREIGLVSSNVEDSHDEWICPEDTCNIPSRCWDLPVDLRCFLFHHSCCWNKHQAQQSHSYVDRLPVHEVRWWNFSSSFLFELQTRPHPRVVSSKIRVRSLPRHQWYRTILLCRLYRSILVRFVQDSRVDLFGCKTLWRKEYVTLREDSRHRFSCILPRVTWHRCRVCLHTRLSWTRTCWCWCLSVLLCSSVLYCVRALWQLEWTYRSTSWSSSWPFMSSPLIVFLVNSLNSKCFNKTKRWCFLLLSEDVLRILKFSWSSPESWECAFWRVRLLALGENRSFALEGELITLSSVFDLIESRTWLLERKFFKSSKHSNTPSRIKNVCGIHSRFVRLPQNPPQDVFTLHSLNTWKSTKFRLFLSILKR